MFEEIGQLMRYIPGTPSWQWPTVDGRQSFRLDEPGLNPLRLHREMFAFYEGAEGDPSRGIAMQVMNRRGCDE